MKLLLHEFIEHWAERAPEKVALTFDQQELTYGQLNQRANRLARYLQTREICVGDFVGIYVDRSLDLIINIIAVLKCGAAYVPLDPMTPDSRVTAILQEVRPNFTIINQHAEFADTRVINTSDKKNEIDCCSEANLSLSINPDSICYVIFTSGTTGKPNGVKISHHNVVNLIESSKIQFDFTCEDVWSLFHSYTFDFSVWEIWGALAFGGRLVIVPYEICCSPDNFYQFIIDEKITVVNQTPAFFYKLIDVMSDKMPDRLNSKLRMVILGGDAYDSSRLTKWFDDSEQKKPDLINMYGITETTVHVTFHKIKKEDLQYKNPVIGKPLPFYDIALIKENGEQIYSQGVVGEIYVTGKGISQGYFNNEVLTRKKFLKIKLCQDSEEKIYYRSGDLGSYLNDDALVYMGRIDRQIKLRGFRIELAEIEVALNSQPEVYMSSVIAAGAAEKKRILAFVQPKNSCEVTSVELRAKIKGMLPAYMVPAQINLLKSMPLTFNNKVNYKALLNNEFEFI